MINLKEQYVFVVDMQTYSTHEVSSKNYEDTTNTRIGSVSLVQTDSNVIIEPKVILKFKEWQEENKEWLVEIDFQLSNLIKTIRLTTEEYQALGCFLFHMADDTGGMIARNEDF